MDNNEFHNDIIDLDRDEVNVYTEIPEENGQYEYCEENSQDQILEEDDVMGLEEINENDENSLNMVLPEVLEDTGLEVVAEKPKEDGMMVVDEWDDDELESFSDEEEKEEDKNVINPELIERALINMPTLKNLYDDTGAFKQHRRVFISPIDLNDMTNEKLVSVFTRPTCQEVKVQWVRNNVDQAFIGILSLNFTTPNSAAKAVADLENFKEGVEIKNDTANAVDEFISKNQMKWRITDCILILKHLTHAATVETIKEMFPGVDDVVLHIKPEKLDSVATTTTPPRGYAYLLFETAELALATVNEAADKHLEIDGHQVFVLQYRTPVDGIPRYYLKLHERKFILRLAEKLKKRIEVLEGIPSAKANLDDAKKRLANCLDVISRDDKCRKNDLDLEQPTLEELMKLRGLPILKGPEREKIMDRYKINKAKKRSPDKTDRSSKSNTKEIDKGYKGGQWRRPPKRNSPPLRRRSPLNFRDQRRGGHRGGYGRNDGPSNIGGPMVNPLALMMQQNLGMMGQGNLLNQNLMIPSILGGGGLLGAQPGMQSLLSGNLDMSGEMLRLDETGNYRSDGRGGGGRYSPHRDMEFAQNKRRRSRSPRMSRGEDQGQSGSGGAPSNPVNLLMNLSQILSQKMENQRMMEKRDRDYRGGSFR